MLNRKDFSTIKIMFFQKNTCKRSYIIKKYSKYRKWHYYKKKKNNSVYKIELIIFLIKTFHLKRIW